MSPRHHEVVVAGQADLDHLGDHLGAVVGLGAVPDDVAQAPDLLGVVAADVGEHRPQRGQVAVDVGDDGYSHRGFSAGIGIARMRLERRDGAVQSCHGRPYGRPYGQRGPPSSVKRSSTVLVTPPW